MDLSHGASTEEDRKLCITAPLRGPSRVAPHNCWYRSSIEDCNTFHLNQSINHYNKRRFFIKGMVDVVPGVEIVELRQIRVWKRYSGIGQSGRLIVDLFDDQLGGCYTLTHLLRVAIEWANETEWIDWTSLPSVGPIVSEWIEGSNRPDWTRRSGVLRSESVDGRHRPC